MISAGRNKQNKQEVESQWKIKIDSYSYINEIILTTILSVDKGDLTIIGVYAPEEGKKGEIEKFYEILQK